ncbi:unnamed protein product [Closterium sp. Naga37s-1]|nr:unnamed protein product [Closterium sp. Naga37s-1]
MADAEGSKIPVRDSSTREIERLNGVYKRILSNTREIERLNGVYKRILSNANVTLVEGRGKLAGPHAVEVTAPDGTVKQMTAKHILIAVGGRPHLIDIPGKISPAFKEHPTLLSTRAALSDSRLMNLPPLNKFADSYLLHPSNSSPTHPRPSSRLFPPFPLSLPPTLFLTPLSLSPLPFLFPLSPFSSPSLFLFPLSPSPFSSPSPLPLPLPPLRFPILHPPLLFPLSCPAFPPTPSPNRQEFAITSDEALSLAEFPKRVVIVGAGYIAVEFAGIFHGMGADVHLVYRQPTPLRSFGCAVHYPSPSPLIASHPSPTPKPPPTETVHLSLGRAPSTHNLGLENAGVETDNIGAIKTNVPSVWAVGDVTNRINLTPVALMEGHCFARTVFGNDPDTPDFENVASAVFWSHMQVLCMLPFIPFPCHLPLSIAELSIQPALAVPAAPGSGGSDGEAGGGEEGASSAPPNVSSACMIPCLSFLPIMQPAAPGSGGPDGEAGGGELKQ